MDLKVLATVFIAVFISEPGDKTQLATLLLSADKRSEQVGGISRHIPGIDSNIRHWRDGRGLISQYVSEKYLHYIAGIGFVGIGIWTLFRA
jgi:putative Ca2+/H+ antiporter (TMEM165/GDT1 family)